MFEPETVLTEEGTLPVLLCPYCGFNHTHHDCVEVYNREEDAKTGLCFVIKSSVYKITNALTGNPSPRRDGIIIKFWCEGCHGRFEIYIVQHKGQTEIYTLKEN